MVFVVFAAVVISVVVTATVFLTDMLHDFLTNIIYMSHQQFHFKQQLITVSFLHLYFACRTDSRNFFHSR